MNENVGTRISEKMVKDIEYLAKEEKTDKSKVIRGLLALAVKVRLFELALEKYSKREISLGRAAELAKIPLVDFMKMVVERKVDMNYSVELLEEDFNAVLKKAKKK